MIELDLSNCGLNAKYSADLGAALAFNTTLTRLSVRNNPLGSAGVQDIVNGLRKQIDTIARTLVPSPRIEQVDVPITGDQGAEAKRPVSVGRTGSLHHVKRRSTAELQADRDAVLKQRKALGFVSPMRSLNLSNTDLTDAVSQSRGLSIGLQQSVLQRAGMRAVAGYIMSPHCGLERLNLSKNPLNEYCMKPLLPALGQNTSLLSVSFKQCGLQASVACSVAAIALRRVEPGKPDAVEFVDNVGPMGVPSPHALFAVAGVAPGSDGRGGLGPTTPSASRPPTAASHASWQQALQAWSRPGTGAQRPGTAASALTFLTDRTMGTYSTWNPHNPMRLHDGIQPTNLLKLSLRGCSIGDEGAARIGQLLMARSNLQELILTQNGISADGFRQLARGIRVGSLVSLDVSQNPLGVEGAHVMASALASASIRLQQLHAGHCCLTQDGTDPRGMLKVAESLGQNRTLRVLTLPGNCLTSQKMSFLRTREAVVRALGDALARNVTLEVLDVSDNWVGVSGQEALAAGLQRAPRATRHAGVMAEVLAEWIQCMFTRRNGTVQELIEAEESAAMAEGRGLTDTFGNPFALVQSLGQESQEPPSVVLDRQSDRLAALKEKLGAGSGEGDGQRMAEFAAALEAAGTQRVAHDEVGKPMAVSAWESQYEVAGDGYVPVLSPGHDEPTEAASRGRVRQGLLSPDFPPYRPPSQMRDGREAVSADWHMSPALPRQLERDRGWRRIATSAPGVGRLNSGQAAQLRMELASEGKLASAGARVISGPTSRGHIVRPGSLGTPSRGFQVAALRAPRSALQTQQSIHTGASLASVTSADLSIGELSSLLGGIGQGRARLHANVSATMQGLRQRAGHAERSAVNTRYYDEYKYGGTFEDAGTATAPPSRLSQREVARRSGVTTAAPSAAATSVFDSGFGAPPLSLADALRIATAGGAFESTPPPSRQRSSPLRHHSTRSLPTSPTVPRLNMAVLRMSSPMRTDGAGLPADVSGSKAGTSPPTSSRSEWSAGGLPSPTGLPAITAGEDVPEQLATGASEDGEAASRQGLTTANVAAHNAGGIDTPRFLPPPGAEDQTQGGQALQGGPPSTAPEQHNRKPSRMHSAPGGPTQGSVRGLESAVAGHRRSLHSALQLPVPGGSKSLVRQEWDARPALHPPSSLLWVKPRLIRAVLDMLGQDRVVQY